MKYYGDVPQNHLDLIKELQLLESWFEDEGISLSRLAAAKGMICMAHDWHSMYMDEEGDRLIALADKLYPDYFKEAIHIHASKDPDFYKLLENLKKSPGYDLMCSLGFQA